MPSSTKKSKKPQDHKPKQARGSVWGSKKTEELELPSGEVALVKRTGIQGLIKAGVLDSMDQLTGIVQGELIPSAEGRPKAAIDATKLMADPKALQKLMELIDKITLEIVVEPEVFPADARAERAAEHEDDEDWEDDAIYVDDVDMEDKMFIFNFAAGGSKDLEKFRQESAEAMGSLGSQQVAQVPTVGADGS